MSSHKRMPYGLMLLSLFVALLLTALPMPTWSVWFRPDWVVLVVLYWILAFPDNVNVGIAWIMGLLLDALSGSLLGEHALALTVIAFIMVRWQRQIKAFPVWQSAFIIGILIAIYKLVIWVIQGVIGQAPVSIDYLFSVITSLLLWPWIQAVLTVKNSVRISLRTP